MPGNDGVPDPVDQFEIWYVLLYLTDSLEKLNVIPTCVRDGDDQLANIAKRFGQRSQVANNTHQVALKVLNKDQDWYLETCNGEMLFKIKQDVIAELMGTNDLFNDINKGQWLALTLNEKGHAQALVKQTTQAMCS